MSIRTRRLIIDVYQDANDSRIKEMLTNDEIKKNFMIPDFKTEEDLNSMVKKLKDYSHSEEHYERGIYLEDELIGFVNEVEMNEHSIELGYVIHPTYQNKGYATEMLQAVIKDLFCKGYDQVIAGAFEENTASFRVMEKCGMSRIEQEDDIVYHGQKRHCFYYAISRKC